MYTVRSNTNLNWNAKGDERILQNVSNILRTFTYEIAFDRVFGRKAELLDKPPILSDDLLIAETYELLEEYEPRVIVHDVKIIRTNSVIIEVVLDIEK